MKENLLNILYAVLVLGIMGMIFGAALAYASKIFAVKVDARFPMVLDALPGVNCGACGFPGCSGLASAIIEGNAPVNGCPVGGAPVSSTIADIMGVTADTKAREVAFVYCNGGDNAIKKFNYDGASDCLAAMKVSGGPMSCKYACIGLGTCVRACPFDAIHIKNGTAIVDNDKCTACSKCVTACPKEIIALKPIDSKVKVACSSKDKGVIVRNTCSVGCIACTLCVKACPTSAITITDNLASIDYSKCINCYKCVEVCPRKIILTGNDIETENIG